MISSEVSRGAGEGQNLLSNL